MIETEKFENLAANVVKHVTGLFPTALQYLKTLERQDAYLASRVLTASRDQRILQVSISVDLASSDAFFKLTGLEGGDQLLQITYPVDGVPVGEIANLFDSWIVGLKSEAWVTQHFKALF